MVRDFPIEPIGSLLFIAPTLEEREIKLVNTRASWRGTVVAKGPDAREVSAGDVVRLKPSNAIEAVFNQTPVWIVREEDILAVEEADPQLW